METTLYDDSSFKSLSSDLKPTKRPATLDLGTPDAKKQKYFSILTSPDLNMLKLASPELEKFIIASSGAITTTPTPTQYLFPKNVTEEQEKYAKGFVDALALLHQTGEGSSATNLINHIMENAAVYSSSSGLSPITSSLTTRNYTGLLPANFQSSVSTSVVTSTIKPSSVMLSSARPPSVDSSNSNSYQGTAPLPSTLIKEELQMVPSDSSSFGATPPLSPIDLQDQELKKLERKRQRNRIAATRCRQRKIERIARLEEKVKELKNENAKLEAVGKELRETVSNLKVEIMNHMNYGCQIMLPRLNLRS